MADILHKVGIKSSSPEDVYKALATVEGLPGGGRATRAATATPAASSNSALATAAST
jgi:hypothetical protein